MKNEEWRRTSAAPRFLYFGAAIPIAAHSSFAGP